MAAISKTDYIIRMIMPHKLLFNHG